MERRLAAILAADVAGYTHLTELNDESSAATLRLYRGVMQEIIDAHHGRAFGVAGDSICAEFPSIVEAIRCSVEIQHEIADRNAGVDEDKRMQLRIGVNLGDVIAEGMACSAPASTSRAARAAGRARWRVRLADRVRPGSQDRRDAVPGHRRGPSEEHRGAGACLPHPVDALVVVEEGAFAQAGPPACRPRRSGLLLLAAIAGVAYLADPAAACEASFSGTGAILPEQPSIGILPFDDLGPDGDQQYLADGITEELVTGLAKFPDLLDRRRVTPRRGRQRRNGTSGSSERTSASATWSGARCSTPTRTSA